MGKAGKKSLLSQLPKAARDKTAVVMAERDGELSLVDFLAKRWDYRGFMSSPLVSDEQNQKSIDRLRARVAELYPELADEFVERLMPYFLLEAELLETAIARRFALEDPGELARRHAIHSRLYKLVRAHQLGFGGESEVLLNSCAVRDIDFARECVDGVRGGSLAVAEIGDIITIGLISILQQNQEALKLVASRPAGLEEKYEWIEGLYQCIVGVARRDPALVTRGLSDHLLGVSKMRSNDWGGAIRLAASGFYRLCEWVDPELVRDFETNRPFPWDAEFHRWCQEHPDPLADVDLTPISTELHEAIVLGRWPEWLPRGEMQRWEVVVTDLGDVKTDLLTVPYPKQVNEYRKELAAMLANGPVIQTWNLPRKVAEHRCRQIVETGAVAEVRPMEGVRYRLFSRTRGKVIEWEGQDCVPRT